MTRPYVLYGWELSFYSGKARAYLRYKAIPYVEKPVRLWTMKTIRRRVGANVMPVVVTPDGEWLQDTSHIIDVLERRFPQAPVVPATPRQRLAAWLLEAWGDEFWLAPAMHYRWNFGENFSAVFQPEGGRDLMPFAPRFVRDRLIERGARAMRGFLPGLGVVPEQTALIERWTNTMLDALDLHFAEYPYLLGDKPCIGDFGLIGPLYAHLGRDPYPARTLIAPRRHVQAWVRRMQDAPHPRSGSYLARDAIPETLTPVFRSVFAEFGGQLAATQIELDKAAPDLAAGARFRRQLGTIEVPYGDGRLRMAARPYSLWMLQRAQDAWHALPEPERVQVRAWLRPFAGASLLDEPVRPRLERVALRVAPETGRRSRAKFDSM